MLSIHLTQPLKAGVVLKSGIVAKSTTSQSETVGHVGVSISAAMATGKAPHTAQASTLPITSSASDDSTPGVIRVKISSETTEGHLRNELLVGWVTKDARRAGGPLFLEPSGKSPRFRVIDSDRSFTTVPRRPKLSLNFM